MMEGIQCNYPTSWLITPGNDAVWGTHCHSLLLADWALSSGCNQVDLGE